MLRKVDGKQILKGIDLEVSQERYMLVMVAISCYLDMKISKSVNEILFEDEDLD